MAGADATQSGGTVNRGDMVVYGLRVKDVTYPAQEIAGRGPVRTGPGTLTMVGADGVEARLTCGWVGMVDHGSSYVLILRDEGLPKPEPRLGD